MALNKKMVGTGIAIWIALTLFLLSALTLPKGVQYLFNANMKPENKLAIAQLFVSIIGFIGAIIAFSFAFYQYKRSEKWKKTEFVASEIKEFEADPMIQNALLMVDWGTRRINLFLIQNPQPTDFIKITREVQWRALLPHTIKRKHTEYQGLDPFDKETEGQNESRGTFTTIEAKIRDTYDSFLTRLDRFATYIDSGLLSPEELKPFIIYWIDAIAKNETPEVDAEWRCTLLTYINFYNYSGVKYLFNCYDKDINPDSGIYLEIKNSITDKSLANRLYESVKPME